MTADIYNWIDGYIALRHRAFQTRGFIELDTGARWPRTTGEEVVAIAALFDPAVRANATAGILSRWRATLADLEHEAVRSPHAPYAENRSFWRTLEVVAVFLDDLMIAPPLPALWDALLVQLGSYTVRNVGPGGDGPFKHFDNVKTYDDLYGEEFKYLVQLRGFDELEPEPGMLGAKKKIPRATNADVIALADYWSKQLSDVKEVFGHEGVEKRWKDAMADVNSIARKGNPSDVYPKNNGFWRVLFETAVHVAVADEAPSKWDMAKDSIKDSITHLPENLEHGASKAADFVASAAHAVGKVANEAGKGLFQGFGTPLLIGAGLLGLFLVTRNSGEHKEA
ncbi:MAG: hypothetical protein JO257_12965 [Deltaproteobacteria bacterium]|nr:hypothetical protein [Deltaproteobacteria bacterium]